ncbi:MAG TPA: excinuclease ABC subunit UvrC [Armatimonadota bacterium]|nr:excinuclease ABC subunit UvrC [Armatimonadota bacterium]
MTETIHSKLASLPAKPGAYVMRDADGHVLYVGKATNLRQRVRSYFQPSGPKGRGPWIHEMLGHVADIDALVTHTPLEALMLELNLIRQHRPPYNTRLSDDKHYPYLVITFADEYPRVEITRRAKQDGNSYYGPYANARALRRTLRTLRQLFGWCTCGKAFRREAPEQPCLDFHLGRCPAPCAGLISKDDYRAHMRRIASFLAGQNQGVVQALRERMEAAAADMRFEAAARIRDQILAIERVCEKQKAISTDLVDRDIIGLDRAEGETTTVQVLYVRAGRLVEEQSFTLRSGQGGQEDREVPELLSDFLYQYYAQAAFVPKEIVLPEEPVDGDLLREWLAGLRGNTVHVTVPRRGEKRQWIDMARQNAAMARVQQEQVEELERARGQSQLGHLRDALGLAAPPHRIECFDISTLQGGESVGSMVVFIAARPAKSEYRKFRIRHETGHPDDYAMMREVLRRRFTAHQAGDEKFADLPDLLVVDGGKGQLGCAREVLAELGIELPVMALAKRHEHVFLPDREDPVVLDPAHEGLNVLVRLRDEAHRFAVTYHRKLRSRTVSRSLLDEIPGIGPKRKQALLAAFPSMDALRKASIDELAAVGGMDTKTAARVRKYLNPTKTLSRRRGEEPSSDEGGARS